jgi:hypothetical protein
MSRYLLPTLWQLRSCFCGAPSLTRGRVCLFYMLLALTSVVFLGSDFLRTRDHILLSQIWEFPFRRLLRLSGSQWSYSNSPPHGCCLQACCQSVRVRVTLRPAVYRQSVGLGAEPIETHGQNFFSQLNTCGHSPYITSSLTRGWVCHLQLPLALASAFILGPSPVGLETVFYCLRSETSLFVATYGSQGHGGGIRPRLHTGVL